MRFRECDCQPCRSRAESQMASAEADGSDDEEAAESTKVTETETGVKVLFPLNKRVPVRATAACLSSPFCSTGSPSGCGSASLLLVQVLPSVKGKCSIARLCIVPSAEPPRAHIQRRQGRL